jgi:hypothetical protein
MDVAYADGTDTHVTSANPVPSANLNQLQRSVGTKPEDVITSMDGLLVQIPGDPSVYLIMEGKRRAVPNPATYARLFNSDCKIWGPDPSWAIVDAGQPLDCNALLVVGQSSGAVYLLTDGDRYWVPNEAILAKYCFNASQAIALPDEYIDQISAGLCLD